MGRRLGGPVWGWFTGWFNLIGLVAVVASVDYACGDLHERAASASTASASSAQLRRHEHILRETFVLFVLILTSTR